MVASFNQGQFVSVRNMKHGELHNVNAVEVDGKQLLKMHYIEWNSKYDELVPLLSSRVGECKSEGRSSSVTELQLETPLNAPTVPCG